MNDLKLDNEIFEVLLKIYKENNNSGKNLIAFSKYKLEKLLSREAFDRIVRGDSLLGKFSLYGGSLGQYYAINILNGDFYKRLRNL